MDSKHTVNDTGEPLDFKNSNVNNLVMSSQCFSEDGRRKTEFVSERD